MAVLPRVRSKGSVSKVSAPAATLQLAQTLVADERVERAPLVERIARILAVVPSLGPATRAWRRLGFEISEPYPLAGCRAADVALDGGGLRFLAPNRGCAAHTPLAARVDDRLVLGAGILGWSWACEDVAQSFASLAAVEGGGDGLFMISSDLTPGAITFLEPLGQERSAEHSNSVCALDHVVLDVSDARAAAGVYSREFGLPARMRTTAHHRYASLEVGSSAVEIVGPVEAKEGRLTGQAWGLAFRSSDLDATVACLRERAIDIAEPQSEPHGGRIVILPIHLGGVGIAFVGD